MLVDAHAHIDWYTDALTEALDQIERHRIVTMAVAMDVPAYLKTKQIAESCSYIIPTFGIHPWEAGCYTDTLHELDGYLRQTPVIGEAGLDFRYVKDEELYPGERLLRSIEQATIVLENGQVSISASMGIASLAGEEDALPEILLERADQMLYEAKNSGRNQLRLWTGQPGEAEARAEPCLLRVVDSSCE